MIQRHTLLQSLTLSVFLLAIPLASCAEAEAANDKGMLYEVTKTEPKGSPMLIEVEDTFRLVFKANDRRVERKRRNFISIEIQTIIYNLYFPG